MPEDNEAVPRTSCSRATLVSMLLMISLLILSSAMLVHYAVDGKDGATKPSLFNLGQLMEKGRELSAKTQFAKPLDSPVSDPSPTTTPKSSTSVVKKLFPGGGQGTVRWPKLKLSGFGLPSKGEVGFAIINKKHVIEGGTIDGAKLVEILEHGVVVEYKGERKTLIIEMTH
jgi:hypothetical protein